MTMYCRQGWGQFQKEMELFNSIPELELELKDFEQKELNEKELILIF